MDGADQHQSLVRVGGAGVIGVLAWMARARHVPLVLAPLCAAWVWGLGDIVRLAVRLSRRGEGEAIAIFRPGARRVPLNHRHRLELALGRGWVGSSWS
jgi:hypothetical protein